MASQYHETGMSERASDAHRALASLQEELEAVDWYNQRVDVTTDDDLKAILEHNRNEEIEHASMILEYLRRNFPEFDEHLKTYLFTSAPVTEIEETAEEGGEEDTGETAAGAGLGIRDNR